MHSSKLGTIGLITIGDMNIQILVCNEFVWIL